MNESLRRSLSRASARGPYALGASPAAPGFGGSPASSMEDAAEVIRRAKQDLERLKKKEIRQRRRRRVSALGWSPRGTLPRVAQRLPEQTGLAFWAEAPPFLPLPPRGTGRVECLRLALGGPLPPHAACPPSQADVVPSPGLSLPPGSPEKEAFKKRAALQQDNSEETDENEDNEAEEVSRPPLLPGSGSPVSAGRGPSASLCMEGRARGPLTGGLGTLGTPMPQSPTSSQCREGALTRLLGDWVALSQNGGGPKGPV